MNLHSNARTTPKSRLELVLRSATCSAEQVAADFAVSSRTVRKWRQRFASTGRDGLADRSSRPHRIAWRTDEPRSELIRRLRQCRLTGPQIAGALRMPRSTVAAVLKRSGLQRLRNLEPRQPENRYERSIAGELIHVDTKKLGRILGVGHRITGNRHDGTRGVGWEFAHVAIDDASRLAYVEVLPDEHPHTAVGFLYRALAFYRRHGLTVHQLMSDNGNAYLSHAFVAACQRFRIRHLRTRPYTPRTNGKAERFIQTLLREWAYPIAYTSSRARTAALVRWLGYYNRHRPHAGLGGIPPYSRLRAMR